MNTDIYEKTLEELLITLTKELKGLGVHNPTVPADWIATPSEKIDGKPDPNDAADRVEDWGERRATLALLEKRYNNITIALQKIKDGAYGICEIGGEHISPERLHANPAARTCTIHMNNESKQAT